MSSSSSPPVKVRVEDVGDDEEDYDQFDGARPLAIIERMLITIRCTYIML